jgi:hypothetical protein
MPITDPPVFFVSYARADAEHPRHRENLEVFVADLSAKVAVGLAAPLKGISFMDVNIQAGEVWSDQIRAAMMLCRVGLPLYTPNYFTRRWCGKEFQILLDRSRPAPGGTGIIPVRWAKKIADPPECVARLQYDDSAFPREYAARGMRQLVELRSVSPEAYELTLEALADRIIDEANAQRLAPLADIDFDTVTSAWEVSTAGDPKSHTQGNISKTCFVFLSRSGWDWVPYQDTPAKIGALAQKITGELGLRYEEIPCNAALSQKLKEANDNDVPTLLFGDPASLLTELYAQPLRRYDSQYLLNCAALVPWEPGAKDTIETDPRWIHLKTKVCRQKVENPPPYHEWRSIFSQEALDLKTRTLIEQIRSRLMKQLISDPNNASPSRRAEDAEISEDAAAFGIVTASLSHLESPSR